MGRKVLKPCNHDITPFFWHYTATADDNFSPTSTFLKSSNPKSYLLLTECLNFSFLPQKECRNVIFDMESGHRDCQEIKSLAFIFPATLTAPQSWPWLLPVRDNTNLIPHADFPRCCLELHLTGAKWLFMQEIGWSSLMKDKADKFAPWEPWDNVGKGHLEERTKLVTQQVMMTLNHDQATISRRGARHSRGYNFSWWPFPKLCERKEFFFLPYPVRAPHGLLPAIWGSCFYPSTNVLYLYTAMVSWCNHSLSNFLLHPLILTKDVLYSYPGFLLLIILVELQALIKEMGASSSAPAAQT